MDLHQLLTDFGNHRFGGKNSIRLQKTKDYFMKTGSPFRSTITDGPVTESPAANVSCHGNGLQPNTVQPGQPTTFTVDASKATVSATPEVVVTEQTSGILEN